MGIFSWLFGSKKEEQAMDAVKSNEKNNSSQWEELPAYIEAPEEEHRLVSVIAAAVAANDFPTSEFKVKKIMKRNPEAELVTLISTAIAAGDAPSSQFCMISIKKEKEKTIC